MTSKTWTVQLTLDEEDDDTRADAALSLDTPMDTAMQLRGRGVSRRNPRDESEPRIGDELAAARALADLAHQLLAAAANDIEAKTHVPARSLQL